MSKCTRESKSHVKIPPPNCPFSPYSLRVKSMGLVVGTKC